MRSSIVRFSAGLFSAALIGVLATGCTPPSAKDLAKKTSASASALLKEAWQSAETTNTMSSVDSANKGISASSQALGSGALSMTRSMVPSSSQSDQTLKVLEDVLTTYVFADENIEKVEGSALIFRIKGDTICKNGGGAACVSMIDKAEVRVRAEGDPETTVILTVLVGPSRFEPCSLKIEKDTAIQLTVDLEAMRNAVEFLNTTIPGSSLSAASIPTMTGRASVRLQKNGPKDFQVSLEALSDINVSAVVNQIARTFSMAKSPGAMLRIDGENRAITYTYDVNRLTYAGPINDLRSNLTSSQPFSIDVSGYAVSATLRDGVQEFLTGDIGFGSSSSTFVFNGQTIFSADFNETLGRAAAFSAKLDTDGMPIVTVTPGAEVKVLVNAAPLEAVGFETWSIRDETITASLKGKNNFVTVRPVGGNASGLKLVAGTFSLSSTKQGTAPFVVTEGQCFNHLETTGDGSQHVLLDELQIIPCP